MDTNENELQNEMNESNVNNTNNENGNKKSKKGIVIASITALLIIIVTVVLCISGVFNSKGKRFVELLTKDQYAIEMVKDRAQNLSSDGETNYTLTLKKKFLSIIDSTFTLLGNDLILSSNVIKNDTDFDSTTSLKLGTLKIQSMELIREDDTVAISVQNLFSGYVAINDENTIEVAEKLGFISSGEDDDIEFEINTKALKILNKYGKTFMKSVNNYIELEKNVPISINGKSFSTKEYTLDLDEKKLNIIALDLLGKLKDDDETLEFLVKYAQENENLDEDIKAEFTLENLKQEVVDLYDDVLNTINSLDDGEAVIVINVNEFDDKAMKSAINISVNDETYEIILESVADAKNDYINLALNMYGSTLDITYVGNKVNDGYSGEISMTAGDASIIAADLSIEKVDGSTATIRSIDSLNALLLNTATDAELEALKREIQINLGFYEDDDSVEELVFGEGEFKLENPDERLELVETSRSIYNQIYIGMPKDDVIALLGEPDVVFEVIGLENNAWYYNDNPEIYFIAVELNDGKVSTVYNDIASSMENNIQISAELGTEIANLNDVMGEVYKEMTKDEVIKILGDKYLEIGKNSLGYTTVKWYDKNENRIIIEFDNENKVSYIDEITMDR